jgi:molybdenum cofactor cytidylyltransferase
VLGHEAEACRRTLDSLRVVVTVNSEWQRGLGSSLAKGIVTLEMEAPDVSGALVMLADQPTVTTGLIDLLISHWRPPQRAIAATLYGSGGGVPAIFDRSFFPELRGLEGDQGARNLIAKERSRAALINPEAVLIDVDTPTAYHAQKPDRDEAKGC